LSADFSTLTVMKCQYLGQNQNDSRYLQNPKVAQGFQYWHTFIVLRFAVCKLATLHLCDYRSTSKITVFYNLSSEL